MPPTNALEAFGSPESNDHQDPPLVQEVARDTMKRMLKFMLDKILHHLPPEAKEQAQAFLGALKNISGVRRSDKPHQVVFDFSQPQDINIPEKYGHGKVNSLHIGNQLKFTPAYNSQTGELQLKGIEGMTADVTGLTVNITDASVCHRDSGLALKISGDWHGISRDKEIIVPLPKLLARMAAA